MPAPFPRQLRGRLAALGRLPTHNPRNQAVRDAVAQRGAHACEYCLMPTDAAFEVEHIVPEARWADYQANRYPGLRPRARLRLITPDHVVNYAWSCAFCNGKKGGRPRRRNEVRFFDPRYDDWPQHFAFDPSSAYISIIGLTDIGKVTVETMGFNLDGRRVSPVAERHVQIARGIYPPHWLFGPYGL